MSFTLIIPIYNSQKYIEKTIESVINQTYKNFKIILIDDKSDDNSLEIIQKYISNKNIKILINNENMGKYKSLNQTLKEINTDYFLILDSYDKILPNRLETENEIFQNNKLILIIQSKVKKIDENTNKIVTNNIYNYNTETYKTSILKKIGFFNENRFGGNLEYFLRVKKFMGTDKIYTINKILTESILRIDKKNLCFVYSNNDMYDYLKKIKKNHTNETIEYFLNNNYTINSEKKTKNFLDIEFYKKSYIDIKNLSNNDIIKHWENIGKNENRLPNIDLFRFEYPNFNYELYYEKNPQKINFSSNYEIYGWIFLKKYDNYLNWLKGNGYINMNNNDTYENNNFNTITYNLEDFIIENNIKFIYLSKQIENENIYNKILKKYNLKKYNPITDTYEKTIFYGFYDINDFNIICTNSSPNKFLLWSNNHKSFDDDAFENIYNKLQKYDNIINLIIYPKIEKVFRFFNNQYIKIIIDNQNFIDKFKKNDILIKYKENFKHNLSNKIKLKNIEIKNNINDNNSINEIDVIFTANWLKNKYTFGILNKNELLKIDKFILILDFPNWGGGTTMFLNFIASYFKNKINILILRQYENLKLFLNDEYEIFFLSDKEIFKYIKSIENKIIKILFNHTIIHKKSTIDFLISLNKEITTITHDYYLINEKPNIYLSSIQNTYNIVNKFNINKADIIISQNIGNMYIFQDHIEDLNKKIIISELPDYKNKKDKIITLNKDIILGIFGSISEIKGLNLLKEIINYFSNSDVKIIIFGNMNDPYKFQFPYKNISELNNLLIKHKPNILIETSLWPETYSYTLTLKMITSLPILYFKKTCFFTVEKRLENYDKAFMFETLKELENLVYKYKQNYFYTIEEKIYFNEFWIDYFIKNNYVETNDVFEKNNIKKNIIIITSKIIVSNNKLNYVNNRSIYSLDQRFEQTLDTIKSIKKHIPNNFIIIIDNSKLDIKKNETIRNIVDIFINPYDDVILSYYTDISKFKAYGEIYQTKIILDKIDELILSKKLLINNLFKITGRYVINDNFDYDNYKNDHNIFKKNENVKDRKYYYTCFYKISCNKFKNYKMIINNIFDKIVKDKSNIYDNVDLEVFLPEELKDFNKIDNLGITQNISVWNDKTNI